MKLDSFANIWRPQAIYREVEPGIRKCQLKTFSYAVIFRYGMGIEILAVLHLRRQPGYWKDRA